MRNNLYLCNGLSNRGLPYIFKVKGSLFCIRKKKCSKNLKFHPRSSLWLNNIKNDGLGLWDLAKRQVRTVPSYPEISQNSHGTDGKSGSGFVQGRPRTEEFVPGILSWDKGTGKQAFFCTGATGQKKNQVVVLYWDVPGLRSLSQEFFHGTKVQGNKHFFVQEPQDRRKIR